MSLYRPNGRGHGALRLLAQAPRTLDELRQLSGATARTPGKKLWLMLSATMRHGFVVCVAGVYSLTRQGTSALARLDAGEAVEVDDAEAARPSVRIFGRAA